MPVVAKPEILLHPVSENQHPIDGSVRWQSYSLDLGTEKLSPAQSTHITQMPASQGCLGLVGCGIPFKLPGSSMPKKSASKRSPSKRSATKKRGRRSSKAADTHQRLQRFLASAGFGSRRQCEELIEAGRVDVDGQIVTKLGSTVDSSTQKVRVDGVLLKKQKSVYYAVNKPVGVVTTNRDPQGRPRVVDLVPPDERVFPVGRLDRSSEGLILLTNDGELAQRLTHPKFGVRKVYRVTVAGKVETETMRQMRKGIHISEGFVQVEGAKLLKSRSRSTEMEIVLREGKNREIRRILARLGHKVQTLRRIAVGPLRLGDVPPGAYRVVTSQEVEKLWTATETAAEETATRGPKKRGTPRKTTARKGPAKTTTSKAGLAKQRGPKKSNKASKGPKSRPKSRKQSGELNFSFDQGAAAGAVIGADADSTEAQPSRSGPKPNSRRSSPEGRTSKTARKSSTKRGGVKKRKTKKGTTRAGSEATSTSRDKNRRGAGRTQVAKKRTGNQKKSGPNRKRRK
ncbi:rRNA pseudouridine synthase [Rubripirellula sp.]|nr:pseudouridine synthase [Rubripirellula sp.]MDB4749369.1 rRNA pseudouridine synthase [Rubripirellula sp.]